MVLKEIHVPYICNILRNYILCAREAAKLGIIHATHTSNNVKVV